MILQIIADLLSHSQLPCVEACAHAAKGPAGTNHSPGTRHTLAHPMSQWAICKEVPKRQALGGPLHSPTPATPRSPLVSGRGPQDRAGVMPCGSPLQCGSWSSGRLASWAPACSVHAFILASGSHARAVVMPHGTLLPCSHWVPRASLAPAPVAHQ